MGVKSKHLATFILGAAAGVAVNKYLNTEDGEKLMESLKEKGKELQEDAKIAVDKSHKYFDDLKTGADGKFSEIIGNLKEKYPEAEKMINDLFASFKGTAGDKGTSAEVVEDDIA